MEATSYLNFIGWKFDMWIQAWKLIHSLQVMYENWTVSFYREKQSLLTVESKNLTTKQRKKSVRLWRGFLAKCFSSGWETVCKKLLNLVQVALTKIPRNEAKIYQETEFHSSEGHLFNFSWLLPDLSFSVTGYCTGHICLLKCLPRFGRERPCYSLSLPFQFFHRVECLLFSSSKVRCCRSFSAGP